MANRPGSIFGAYGSSQNDVIAVTDDTTIDIDVIDDEEVEIIVEDSVHFDNNYNNLTNKPKVKYGTDGTATELSGTVDLKDVIGTVTGGMQMVECNTQATDPSKTATCEGFELEENTWFEVKMANINTSASLLTLSINEEDAKEIWINGVRSSSSNYFLGKGVHSVYYNGTYYNFSNDAAPAVANMVAHPLIFNTTPSGSTPVSYDGHETINIGGYNGSYT